jgi:hypothetical protein
MSELSAHSAVRLAQGPLRQRSGASTVAYCVFRQGKCAAPLTQAALRQLKPAFPMTHWAFRQRKRAAPLAQAALRQAKRASPVTHWAFRQGKRVATVANWAFRQVRSSSRLTDCALRQRESSSPLCRPASSFAHRDPVHATRARGLTQRPVRRTRSPPVRRRHRSTSSSPSFRGSRACAG